MFIVIKSFLKYKIKFPILRNYKFFYCFTQILQQEIHDISLAFYFISNLLYFISIFTINQSIITNLENFKDSVNSSIAEQIIVRLETSYLPALFSLSLLSFN